ncbi:MAG: hypothetical protein QM791_11215 [Ferruginibacter sp.]
MKRFIYTLSLFAVFALFFYLLAIVLWGRYTPQFLRPNLNYRVGTYGHTFTRLKEVKQVENIDILFLGSSHAYRGFDTRIFKSHGLRTFNLGSSSQTPLQTLLLVERYLDKLKPGLVIFEVNPLVFSLDGVESSLDIIANDQNDLYSYEMAFKINHIKTYNSLLYSIHRDALKLNKSFNEPVKKDNDTYIEGGFVENKMAYYRPVEMAAKEIVLPKNQLKAFEKCMYEIKKRNIEVILVYAPVTHSVYSSATNNKYFDKVMAGYSTYYNFNEMMNLADSLYFYDPDHLNQKGVEIFNNKLIDVLKERHGNTVKGLPGS